MMMTDVKFKIAMMNTLKYTVITVPCALVFGFLIAVLIHDYAYTKNVMKIGVFLPYISSLVAITVVWKVLLNPTRGPVNMMLMALGVQNPPGWFASSQWAIVGVALETIWLTIGYNVVLYMAGFTSINTDLYDAASIDGCGGIRKVLHVTIPGAAPTTFFLTIMSLIGSFKVFDQVSIIQAGSPSADSSLVIAYDIYLQAFQYYKMGYASAMSWVMFAIILVITLIQWRFDPKN
jgi:multiple sugar transport system permease protein